MTYVSSQTVRALTGTTMPDDRVAAILVEADREVCVYLCARGAAAPPQAGDAISSAALSYAKALILEYGLQTGSFEASAGDFSSHVNVTSAVQALRKTAAGYLDGYLTVQESHHRYVVRVDGR